jgi:hypothetical protein
MKTKRQGHFIEHLLRQEGVAPGCIFRAQFDEFPDGMAFRVVKRLEREGQFPDDVDILIYQHSMG